MHITFNNRKPGREDKMFHSNYDVERCFLIASTSVMHLSLDNKHGNNPTVPVDRSLVNHPPHQSRRQRDEPFWLQSRETAVLQNGAGEVKKHGESMVETCELVVWGFLFCCFKHGFIG